MLTIHKYPLVDNGEIDQTVCMPSRAHILTVQLQYDKITLWAEVDTGNPIVPRLIHIYGTGHKVWSDRREYIGTVQQDGFVWHVYEII